MASRVGARSWAVVALLLAFQVVNFGEKSVLGLVAVPLSTEFGLNHTEYGFISSSFFFLYSLASLVVGFIATRVRAYWILPVLAILWSAFQLPVAVITAVPLLLAARIGLGAAEGPATPLVTHTVQDWFPAGRRGVPTALTMMGGAVGIAIAAPTLTFLLINHGWRSPFVALAVAGLIWAVAWLFIGRPNGPYADAHTSAVAPDTASAPPLWRTLASPTWIGTLLVCLAAYWALTLTTAWLPAYLEKGLHYAPATVGTLMILPSVVGVAMQLGMTYTSDRLVRRGVRPRLARGLILGLAGAVGGLCLVVSPAATGNGAVALLVIGLGAPTGCIALGQLLFAEQAAPRQRAAVLGIADALVPLPGLVAPVIMGHQIDAATSPLTGFGNGWMLTGVLLIIGGGAACALVNPRRMTAAVPAALKEEPAR